MSPPPPDARRETQEYNATAELLREFEKLTSTFAAARSESAEQNGRVLGAVGALTDQVRAIENVQRTQATEIVALHEGIKKARDLALEAKTAADRVGQVASEESKAAMRAYADLQVALGAQGREIASVKTETAEQTKVIESIREETQEQTAELRMLVDAAAKQAEVDKEAALHRKWQRDMAEAAEKAEAQRIATSAARRTRIKEWLAIVAALFALIASTYGGVQGLRAVFGH